MCGILALLDHSLDPDRARELAVRQGRILRHRGPDWSGAFADGRFALAHERLAIVDVLGGAQPLVGENGRLQLAVNGEIYDHRELRARYPWDYRTDSDCEVLLPMWRAKGSALFDELSGMYAFVAVDTETGDWIIGRDHLGIIPLYVGRTPEGHLAVASEMKALVDICTHVQVFPAGHYQTSSDAAPVRWYRPEWEDFDTVDASPAEDPDALRAALDDAVRSHLMGDVPYGVLLSGGLDSSVVAALAAKRAAMRVESDGAEPAWWPRLHSFCIGLEGSPDLAAAESLSKTLGTAHHGFTFTVQDGLDALRDVIWMIETFDVTTVRASTPMYLMARRIKAMGVKMVLSGEGSDEIFGGYLYFHKAPDARAFHEENVRKLYELNRFDCLRANKSMCAFGVEARVPFLDRKFVDHAMRIPARHKLVGDRGIEKRLLREAFDGWLPHDLLWRQKEQFSDGVGYGWIDALKDHAERTVSDRELAEAAERFPVGTPNSKEGYVYRAIFDELFPLPSAAATVPSGPSIACSSPAAIAWDAEFANRADPSGRAVRGVHNDAT
ncbi:MAG: asparagine synthase B [Planctomycetota bacterium]|jgi:asparagine synthase (glutamine-hydrolysing)